MKGIRVIAILSVLTLLTALPVIAGYERAGKDESLRKGETRPTLDPNLFQDAQVREAYQTAKKIPWVLDIIYCYCFCEESFQHKSVLSCYVDRHATV